MADMAFSLIREIPFCTKLRQGSKRSAIKGSTSFLVAPSKKLVKAAKVWATTLGVSSLNKGLKEEKMILENLF